MPGATITSSTRCPTSDYYALYGIFASTKYAFPGTEIYRHTKDFVPLGDDEETAKLREWESELAEADDKLELLLRELNRLRSARDQRREVCTG